MKASIFGLLVCFMIFGCSDNISEPILKDAQVGDAQKDTQTTNGGCFGPAGTFKMLFELQESLCDDKYTEGKKFTENLIFDNLKCEKREVIKWDYKNEVFYKCLSTLLIFADHYEGQWVCMLYHNMDHPFCGFVYKITMEK